MLGVGSPFYLCQEVSGRDGRTRALGTVACDCLEEKARKEAEGEWIPVQFLDRNAAWKSRGQRVQGRREDRVGGGCWKKVLAGDGW